MLRARVKKKLFVVQDFKDKQWWWAFWRDRHNTLENYETKWIIAQWLLTLCIIVCNELKDLTRDYMKLITKIITGYWSWTEAYEWDKAAVVTVEKRRKPTHFPTKKKKKIQQCHVNISHFFDIHTPPRFHLLV